MAEQGPDDRQSRQEQDEYVRRGKGRKDEVGGSGIYPASSPDAPADAEIRSESEFVKHKGPRQTPGDEQQVTKGGERSGSE